MGKQDCLTWEIRNLIFRPSELFGLNINTPKLWISLVVPHFVRIACMKTNVLECIAFVSKAEETEILPVLLSFIVLFQAGKERNSMCVEIMFCRNRVVPKIWHLLSQTLQVITYLFVFMWKSSVVDISEMKNNPDSSLQYELIDKVE